MLEEENYYPSDEEFNFEESVETFFKDQERLKEMKKEHKEILSALSGFKKRLGQNKKRLIDHMVKENIPEYQSGTNTLSLNKKCKVNHDLNELRKLVPDTEVDAYLTNVSTIDTQLSVKRRKVKP